MDARSKPEESDGRYVLERGEDKDKEIGEKDEKDEPELVLSVRND